MVGVEKVFNCLIIFGFLLVFVMYVGNLYFVVIFLIIGLLIV